MKSNYLKSEIAKLTFGLANDYESPVGQRWISLHYTLPNSDGTGGIEVADSGYSRKQLTAATEANGTAENSTDISFGDMLNDSLGLIKGCAVWDASSGGNLLVIIPSLGVEVYGNFVAATDVCTVIGNTFTNGQKIEVSQLGDFPLPVTAGTYFVKAVAGNEFELSLTQGGSSVAVSDGVAMLQANHYSGFFSGDTVRIKANKLTITEG